MNADSTFALIAAHPNFFCWALGPAGSFFITQTLKMYLPNYWSEGEYRRTVNVIAIMAAFVISHAACGEVDKAMNIGLRLALSFSSALATPTLYKITIGFASKRWPWFNGIFSGRPARDPAETPRRRRTDWKQDPPA